MLQNNFMKIFSFSGSFRKNETILKEFGYVEVVVQLSTSARPLCMHTPLYLYTAFRETGFHTVFNTPS